MTDATGREVTVYVQSRKVVSSFYRPPPGAISESPDAAWAGAGRVPSASGAQEPSVGSEEYFLSDEQARCLAMVEEMAARRGFRVRTVDLGRSGPIERLFTDRLRGVETLPVLVGSVGPRLEGTEAFTEEAVAATMPADLPMTRAFSYLKLRGGEIGPVRSALLAFPEVREVHVLTGDWDLFLVLEFSGSGEGKRRILEFVTSKIRSIPDVVDTSTLVPEWSVSKFPF